MTNTQPPKLSPEELAAVREALDRVGSMMATDSRDWSLSRRDAWLYGLFCGWECDDDHEHDDVCGGSGALDTVAEQHGWTDEDVARLRRYHAAIHRLAD